MMNFVRGSKKIKTSPRTHSTNCHLLYLIGELHTGGSERQLYYLLRAMDRDRYNPAVVVWSYGGNDVYVRQVRERGVPIHFFPNKFSSARKLMGFRRLVKKLRPEVVHSYSFYTNFAAYWANRGTDAIPIGSIRSDFSYAKNDCGPLLGRLSARWPSTQTSNSSAVAEEIRHCRDFFIPKRLSVVRNAVDLDQYRYAPLPVKSTVDIAAIGYLLPVKRWDRLLLALKELRKENLDFSVQIAGDGPLRSTLEKKTTDLELADRVKFLGHIDNIPQLLAKAVFLVHTADSEGSPNSVLEAMACGRAIVSTDVGDVSTLVEDGKTGFVVRRGDDRALVQRMRMLITDHDLCTRMGIAARAKAEEEFGLDRLIEETLA